MNLLWCFHRRFGSLNREVQPLNISGSLTAKVRTIPPFGYAPFPGVRFNYSAWLRGTISKGGGGGGEILLLLKYLSDLFLEPPVFPGFSRIARNCVSADK